MIGRVINERFRITGVIARGGMGKVYLAEQAPLGRACALKVLSPDFARGQDPEFHKRFFLEASLTSKLTHPNTVTIFDYGRTDDDIYFMAMEHLEGHTLHRAIREAGHFPEERVTHIALQICRALREAHALGVIHRDLKPANIFLVDHGDAADFVKVLDFGLVKKVSGTNVGDELTKTGLFMGSPKYMAPEQISGEKVDVRTDVYALGIIMYEMMTGKVPFDSTTSVNILMAQVKEAAASLREMNPSVQASPEMEETIARCMCKSPGDRFPSMDEVLAALKRINANALGASTTGEHRALSLNASGPQASPLAAGSIRPRVRAERRRSSAPHERASSGSVRGSRWSVARPDGAPSTSLAHLAVLPGRSGSKGCSTWPCSARSPWRVLSATWLCAQAPQGSRPCSRCGRHSRPPVVPVAVDSSRAVTAMAKVRINTDPDGAGVKEDGVELCSSTPCDILYKGADADPSREHKLTVARQGYRSETRSVKVTDSALTVKLARAEVPRIVPQAAARPEGAARTDRV